MIQGAVLHHKAFTFLDGSIGNKLLVILNTPATNDSYLLCRTTSHCKYHITNEGCYEDKGIYHIKANRDGFKEDTWIQLSPVYELTKLNCIQKGDDFTQYQADLMFK